MGGFKLGKMTLGSLFKKPETVLYPVEKKEAPAGLKGHIVNDVDVCILCGICQRRCPCAAIVVEKPNRKWDYRQVSLRPVRHLCARVPEALPIDGARLAGAFEGDVYRVGRRPRASQADEEGKLRTAFSYRPLGEGSQMRVLKGPCGVPFRFRQNRGSDVAQRNLAV